MQKPTEMPGVRKAAILTLVLGPETSSNIFKHLRESEIESITREVAQLGAVSAQVGERVLEEFNQLSVAAAYVAQGGVAYAQQLLDSSLGPATARRILDRVVKSFQTTAGFTTLAKTDPQQLSKFILAEQPQTIALILAHLDASHAAQVISLLPESMRVDVITRMAQLDEISPDVVSRISTVIEQRLKGLGTGAKHETYGGVKAVAELLNRSERSISQPVIDAIENESPDLAVSIRNLMFVFEDLVHVDDNGIREIVKRADRKTLTVALKGSSEEIKARFFQNMSRRAVELIREELDVLGAIRLREVERAQQEVVGIARKLEQEGLLVTGAAGGEAYVV